MGVSVLILTHNEEKHIKECIESCPFADEIVVIDDNSTDNTVALATSLGAKVVNRALNGDFGAQRQFAIEQATEDWIFFIDADERCSPKLMEEITELSKKEANIAYDIRRESVFKHFKASHGPMRPDIVPRFMPREGVTVKGKVHEMCVSIYPKKMLKGHLDHYTYDTYDQYVDKINAYARISVDKYIASGKKPKFIKDLVLRPQWAFFKTYILDRGFLDGKIGFILAVNHFNYTFQKYARFYFEVKTGGKF